MLHTRIKHLTLLSVSGQVSNKSHTHYGPVFSLPCGIK